MEVQVEPVGPCRMRVSVTVPPESVRSLLDDLYQEAGQRVRIKGFRPGKIPRRLLEERFGDAILHDARHSLLNRTFREVVQEHDLEVLGDPELEGEGSDLEVRPQQPFSYKVQVDVRPRVEVGEVKGVKVERHPVEPTGEEVQEALQRLAEAKRKLVVVQEPVADGDFAQVDMVYKADGETVLERTGLKVNTQIPLAGTEPGEFSRALQGRAAGQEVSIPLVFPVTFEKEELRGKQGEVVLRIHEVSRVVTPAQDDALARQYDFESLEAMGENVRRRIAEEKARAEQERQERAILDALLQAHPFEVPRRLVEHQSKVQMDRLASEWEEQGVPPEEIERRKAEVREESDAHAERAVRTFFLMEAVARKEKIFATEADVEAELRAVAARHGKAYEEVRGLYEEKDLLGNLRADIRQRKVRQYLRENADLRENAQFSDSG